MCFDAAVSVNTVCSRVRLATSTTLLPWSLPNSTHLKQVMIADGVPRGPVCRPSRRMLVKTSAPSNKSVPAGVLKSRSASFNFDKWSHLRASGIGCSGTCRSFVIFFSTNASTPIFSPSSSTPDTWNHTDPCVRVLVSPIPFTLAFLLLHIRGKCRCCARRSWMN